MLAMLQLTRDDVGNVILDTESLYPGTSVAI